MTLPRAQVLELLKDAEEMKEVEIDLESQKVIREDGTSYPFEIDPFRKNCLLHGLDGHDAHGWQLEDRESSRCEAAKLLHLSGGR